MDRTCTLRWWEIGITSQASARKFTHARPYSLVLLGALLLTSCTTGDESEPQEDRPAAPQRAMPEPAEEHLQSTADVPIEELADPDWVQEEGERFAIPRRALTAYAGVALRMEETHPECGIGWNTLAAVGSVETSHASFGDAGLDAEGVVQPAIIGPVLDGSEGVQEVPDTDDGELDGDEEWDRAVGPMQFIPETWRAYAQDGNLDGEEDPQQIDDAVLTAAVYLCDSGDDLTNDDDWVFAITTYNQSMEYARNVASIAESYAQ